MHRGGPDDGAEGDVDRPVPWRSPGVACSLSIPDQKMSNESSLGIASSLP
jgi:hypothetical protein